ncbi:F-box/kelch-repeat protein At3g23880-like [Rhododendron vialii]|uniref:F-box/kelch-repeat protein At3g23880-like n=1 Tax=Rhododendron vialii TaxID=182163 RepID=UPI0026601DC5|nr:F-box/kelch-repeat protein At3g23880-like [Rhododendron vialii]
MPPSLQETKPLPPFVFGFGAHPTTHECMLVFILYEWVDVKQQKFPSKVELYTQGTGSWRSIASVGHPHLIARLDCLQAFVNGAIHWIALESGVGDGLSNTDACRSGHYKLIGPAHFVVWRITGGVMSWTGGFCGMWVMKKYGVAESWAKLYTIPLTGVSGRIIGFRENGEFLVSASDKLLLCYDCKTKTWTNTGYSGSSDACTADTFMESLVLAKP